MATRTQRLAQPKPNRLRHPDRRSVYWLDEIPPQKTGPTTSIDLSPRWLELTRSKKQSPVWQVSAWALRAVPSERLCSLAQPRVPVAGWQPDRPLLVPSNTDSSGLFTYLPTGPPKKQPVPGDSGHKADSVSMVHLPYRASAHTGLLATPKGEHPSFKEERSVWWPVSRAARNHVASQRVVELSVPKERKALFEGYDPYVVSRAARSASPSPRTQQLCLPLPRKCSSK
ncbi:hypothetical protein Q5P01_020679 [Channa striata]|uniref:Testicular haploid expressed gene protein-like n=1 Tax=Channa striata TaxID=64152 RepID=A0AA88S9A0_CHASR|nr:hypothetical protein Q5P01_020679 [Channa striata]